MSRKILVGQLTEARRNFVGLGTRRAKLQLNRLGKTNPEARALRLALEIEDRSTQAKKYFGEWRDKCYAEKSKLVLDLIRLFEIEGWTYGSRETGSFPGEVIYFEIPNCEQISFHCTLIRKIPRYQGEWDEQRNSTLRKIEQACIELFDRERNLFRQKTICINKG